MNKAPLIASLDQYQLDPRKYEMAHGVKGVSDPSTLSSPMQTIPQESHGFATISFVGPDYKMFYMANNAEDYAAGQAEDAFIQEAIDRLKQIIRDRLGESVRQFSLEYMDSGDSSEDSVNYIVLVGKLVDVTRQRRHELYKELNRHISASNSRSIRRRLVVNFR